MSNQEEIGIIILPESSEDVEVEWVATWDDVEVRKVGVTIKLGDHYERCDKWFYSSLVPDSP